MELFKFKSVKIEQDDIDFIMKFIEPYSISDKQVDELWKAHKGNYLVIFNEEDFRKFVKKL